jgi:uncharacterized protein YndB with AHSA1/START domain
MPDMVHEVMIEADPEVVYAALTEQQGLAKWWTDTNTASPEVGSEADFVFEGGQMVFKMKIDELSPGERVAWSAIDSPVPGWPGTTVTYDLTKEETGTKLLFGHRGWPSIDGPFPSINFSWAIYLQSLKDYLETGTGAPHIEPS